MPKKAVASVEEAKFLDGIDDTTNVRMATLAGTIGGGYLAYNMTEGEELWKVIAAVAIGAMLGNVIGQYVGKATEGFLGNFLPPAPVV
jgi:outer membrane lipoprotein SlyB